MIRKVHSIWRRYSNSREESRQGQDWQKKPPIVSASSGCVMTMEYKHLETQLKEDYRSSRITNRTRMMEVRNRPRIAFSSFTGKGLMKYLEQKLRRNSRCLWKQNPTL